MDTPLIKQVNRSSLVIFPSAMEDFEIISQSDRKREVSFSHFALLNLPKIAVQTNKDNVIDFDRIESVHINGVSQEGGNTGDRLDLSESLQNYLLNFDTLLTEQEWYNKNSLKNSTERIFWKWAKEIGAIRYQEVGVADSIIEGRYTEESDSDGNDGKNPYSRVVQYVGAIGVQNQVKGRKNSFREIYLLVPSSSGATPKVLFKSDSDENYFPNMAVIGSGNGEYINGYDENSPALQTGLDLLAQYDRDVIGIDYTTLDESDSVVPNWFDYSNLPDSYLTESLFNDARNETLIRDNGDATTKEIYRSKLDGVSIDLDFNNYVANSGSIDSFEEYNRSLQSKSFKFNALLLYYTVTDVDTQQSETNLFGVSFLGDVEQLSAGSSIIETTTKIKNDELVGESGNAFGFRFNFKLDARQDNTVPTIEVDFSEETNFGMQLFSRVMGKYEELISNYEDIIAKNSRILEINNDLNAYINSLSILPLEKKYEELVQLLEEYNAQDVNNDLLEEMNSTLQNLLRGSGTIDINLMFDVISGQGIKAGLDKSTNKLTIATTSNYHSEVEVLDLDTAIGNSNITTIGTRNKFIKVKADSALNEEIKLRLDDSSPWKKGQVLEIKLSEDVQGNAILKVYTDAAGVFNQEQYNYLITSRNVESDSYIKIICIDPKTFEFSII